MALLKVYHADRLIVSFNLGQTALAYYKLALTPTEQGLRGWLAVAKNAEAALPADLLGAVLLGDVPVGAPGCRTKSAVGCSCLKPAGLPSAAGCKPEKVMS